MPVMFSKEGYEVTVEYSFLDETFVFKVQNEEKKSHGYGDGASVDELEEAIEDIIHTMDTVWDAEDESRDHEERIIAEEQSLTDEELEMLREQIKEAAEEYDEQNREFIEYKGYKIFFMYEPEARFLTAHFADLDLEAVQRKSLQSLTHHALIAIQQYLDTQARALSVELD